MKERLNYIDWLKGIAIIAVVIGHVISFDFFIINRLFQIISKQIHWSSANAAFYIPIWIGCKL